MPARRLVIFALAFLAAFLNILPRLFLPPGGDVLVHYSLIECFSRQLWEGHLYPRWCIEGNAGLGGSDFLFYFPLPYYLTALFYPLRHLGLSIEGMYLSGLFVASAATFITCYLWLSDVADKKIALAAAFLFLWLPYRSELLYYRSAYPELCEMAVLPLLFLWLRCAASGRPAGWPCLAFITALALFTHVPTAIIGIAAGSLYLILLAPRWRTLLALAAGLALGLAVCAIYVLPAEYFLAALDPVALAKASHEWSSGFLTATNFHHQGQAALGDLIGLAALVLLAIVVIARRRRIEDGFTRRELVAWCVIAALAFFMLFAASAPVWGIIKAVVSVAATPWRLQMLLMFALIYLFAVYGNRLVPPAAAHFTTGNYALLCGFMILLSLSMTASLATGHAPEVTALKNIHLMGITRYSQTRWADAAHSGQAYLLAESTRKDREPRVDIIKGAGSASVRQWDDDGIIIEAALKEKSLLRLRQLYFPLWHATIDGTPAALSPEENTGRMLLSVPAGQHHIRIYTSLDESLPQLYPLAQVVSAAGALIVLLGFGWRRRRRHCDDIAMARKK